jgi:hypothetical protein
MPSAVANGDVLRPVARDREAEREDPREHGSVRPGGGGVRAHWHRRPGRPPQPPEPPQSGTREQDETERGHHEVQGLTGTERQPVRRIVAEEIDEDPRERIPEHEPRGERTGRGVVTADGEQIQHQQQVLRSVVQDHGVAESVRIRKLHGPPHVGDAADDLTVDEIADPAHAHEERAGHHQRIGQEQERLLPKPCVESRRDGRTDEQPVGRHSAEPHGRYQRRVLTVERPFVERDLDGAAAGEDAGGEEDRESPDVAPRQTERPAVAHQEPQNVQEAERETKTVPPEVEAAHVGDHGIDVVNVSAVHAFGGFQVNRPSDASARSPG